jgi:hypothetical protein
MDSRFRLSPEGVALWPYLSEPESKNGYYNVKLKVESSLALPLVKEIDGRLKASLETAKARALGSTWADKITQAAPPYNICDNGTAYLFTFKLRSSGVSRGGKSYKNKPLIYDANGFPKRCAVGHGSSIRVSFEYEPYHTLLVGAGVAMRLVGVQVIDLVDPKKLDAVALGFAQAERVQHE